MRCHQQPGQGCNAQSPPQRSHRCSPAGAQTCLKSHPRTSLHLLALQLTLTLPTAFQRSPRASIGSPCPAAALLCTAYLPGSLAIAPLALTRCVSTHHMNTQHLKPLNVSKAIVCNCKWILLAPCLSTSCSSTTLLLTSLGLARSSAHVHLFPKCSMQYTQPAHPGGMCGFRCVFPTVSPGCFPAMT